MSVVQIVNYGLGNLGSVANMLKRLGVKSRIISAPDELVSEKIILPGVGSFDTGMDNLRVGGWIDPLNDKVLKEKIPVLGICLGMQLMTKSSEEGVKQGLGWIDGVVLKFPAGDLKIPHMGWNVVTPVNISSPSILANAMVEELRFYFVHSYYVRLSNSEDRLGITTYGGDFTSAFHHENLYGVQFHPEKSHKYGMNLLKNFASL